MEASQSLAQDIIDEASVRATAIQGEIYARQTAVQGASASLQQDINDEINARATAVAYETSLRATAVQGEANARATAIQDASNYWATVYPTPALNAIATAVQSEAYARATAVQGASSSLQQDINNEIQARKTAVQGETNLRATAIQGEADARATAVQGEAYVRATAIAGASSYLSGEISAEIQARETAVQGEIYARETAVQGEVYARETAIMGASQSLAADITAEVHARETAIQGEVNARATAIASASSYIVNIAVPTQIASASSETMTQVNSVTKSVTFNLAGLFETVGGDDALGTYIQGFKFDNSVTVTGIYYHSMKIPDNAAKIAVVNVTDDVTDEINISTSVSYGVKSVSRDYDANDELRVRCNQSGAGNKAMDINLVLYYVWKE